ncbi:hypothetical protein ACFSQT_16105 [Mesorhizobium calcicola]|uniref:Uncharacterized protein n=1 Tax=Mesorhizobium calcicola TaxID=1300310 RepID=A0ABW4WGC1_9HYPH
MSQRKLLPGDQCGLRREFRLEPGDGGCLAALAELSCPARLPVSEGRAGPFGL